MPFWIKLCGQHQLPKKKRVFYPPPTVNIKKKEIKKSCLELNAFKHQVCSFLELSPIINIDMGQEDLKILKSVFGFDEYLAGQERIIAEILSGKDVLTIMPTGGGKSLCYQLPALMFKGMTVVVSPLIALMQSQVAHLQLLGIASRQFIRSFALGEDIKVKNAKLENGLLTVDLEREIPEEKKPRLIEVH